MNETPPLNDRAINIAARLIRQASDEKLPADALLRQLFRASGETVRRDSAEISHIVYTFYRWSQFTNSKDTLSGKIRSCLRNAERFAQNPEYFSTRDMMSAIPHWVKKHVQVRQDWLRSIQRGPTLWLRARRESADELRKKLTHDPAREIAALPEAIAFTGHQDLFRTPEFKSGNFEIQDISSQAVGRICDPKPGETWWDTCSGEGGKLLHLSNLMDNKGLIWATDRSKRRLEILKKRSSRAQAFNIRRRNWDGSENLPSKTMFDGVLVDAPCSGLGTWGRLPHARWTTNLNDVNELAEVQKRLLKNVARSVKRGGRLVYAVCTLTFEETTQVVEDFSKRFPEFHLEIPDLPGIERDEGEMTSNIWPQTFGGNGMFVAVWRRQLEPDVSAPPETPETPEP
jgi:16S rRNA (cytosine967-C5)-methyltransferase